MAWHGVAWRGVQVVEHQEKKHFFEKMQKQQEETAAGVLLCCCDVGVQTSQLGAKELGVRPPPPLRFGGAGQGQGPGGRGGETAAVSERGGAHGSRPRALVKGQRCSRAHARRDRAEIARSLSRLSCQIVEYQHALMMQHQAGLRGPRGPPPRPPKAPAVATNYARRGHAAADSGEASRGKSGLAAKRYRGACFLFGSVRISSPS